uniref:DYW domain-containing protein n=1 Tax=Kalanchoe fedtschenkoi TaxID=63787 RepID=A0A7N0V9C6_KALFE
MSARLNLVIQHSAVQLILTKSGAESLIRSCPLHLSKIHALLLTSGSHVKDSLMGHFLTSLTVLGDVDYARKLFDKMRNRRVYLWNTLIKGYVKGQIFSEAASLFSKMLLLGVRPDCYTFPFVIKGCIALESCAGGASVHGNIVKCGLEFVACVRTELIIMYAGFCEMDSADLLFKTMVCRDQIAWNAFIAACVQSGYAAKALLLFEDMGVDEIRPDSITIVSALSACGQLGCLETGEKIYRFALEQGVCVNIIVDNARIDMYAKCGSIDSARSLFDQMRRKNLVSWSTMIGGYGINGRSQEALALFSCMQREVITPNYVVLLSVLWACCHAGLVSEGSTIFSYMEKSEDKNLKPRLEHYSCMVDLLGRSGYLDEAWRLVRRMPIEPNAGVWGALLSACTRHKNVNLGEHAADMLYHLAPCVASYHILSSNMYAAVGRWDSVQTVRQKMRQRNISKVASCSSVIINGRLQVLYIGDRTHPRSADLYEKLEKLIEHMKIIGYVPVTSSVLHDVEWEEKEVSVGTHSEKLAIALGLLCTRPGTPIRLMKNLRVCDECHNFSKFASDVTKREIIMRDKILFHHFKEGVCSCKDFW